MSWFAALLPMLQQGGGAVAGAAGNAASASSLATPTLQGAAQAATAGIGGAVGSKTKTPSPPQQAPLFDFSGLMQGEGALKDRGGRAFQEGGVFAGLGDLDIQGMDGPKAPMGGGDADSLLKFLMSMPR